MVYVWNVLKIVFLGGAIQIMGDVLSVFKVIFPLLQAFAFFVVMLIHLAV